MKTNLDTKLNFTSESELARYCEEYMKRKNECNGWSNYATWRIALEMVDGARYEYAECGTKFDTLSELAENIKSDCEDLICDEVGECSKSFMNDYAIAFLSMVNWYEIAENIAGDNSSIIIENK